MMAQAHAGYSVIEWELGVNEIGSQPREDDGTYVARRNGEIVISAPTYDELIDELDRLPIDPSALVIEYVEPTDRIRVY